MGDLSFNFSSREFACPCCGKVKIEPVLVKKLQALRDHLGSAITVTSGFRCPAHNADVGGVAESFHLLGQAADISCEPSKLFELWLYSVKLFNGVGYYPTKGFVHVDLRPNWTHWEKGLKYV